MEDTLRTFFSQFPIRTYGKGQVILRPEHEENHTFFILSGFVRAHTITEEGNEFSAALLGARMYFPIFRYFSDRNYLKKLITKYYYSSVVTTKIVSVNNADVIKHLTDKPQVAIALSDIYYFNIGLLQSKLEFMSYTHSAYKKVCYFLIFLSKKFGQLTEQGILLSIPFTHKDLATFVGLSRESVSHQLSLLKKMDIIDESRQTICIKHLQLLEDEMRK